MKSMKRMLAAFLGLVASLLAQPARADVVTSGPLPAGWWKTLLHLGADFNNHYLNSNQESNRDYDYLSDYGGEASQQPYPGLLYTNLSAASTGDKSLTWTPLAITAADGRWMTSPDKHNYVKYWHIYLIVPGSSDRLVRFHYRTDDDLRMWVNGTLAISRNGWDNGAVLTQDGTLYAGLNAITIKLREGSGGDHMAMRVTDRSNADYTDLSYTLSPGSFTLTTLPATEVGETTATLNGDITIITEDAFTVWAVWSTNDWGEAFAAWQAYGGTASLGQPEDGAFDYQASGLASNTTHYYRLFATNDSDTAWSDKASSFKTLGLPPTVDNASGATGIGGVRAFLNGRLTGGSRADCRIYLGTTDGVWTQSYDFGSKLEGSFSVNAGGLALSTTYYYRTFASNDYGVAWSATPASFTTATTSA